MSPEVLDAGHLKSGNKCGFFLLGELIRACQVCLHEGRCADVCRDVAEINPCIAWNLI
ncbi:MAG: hypothetical protein U0L42_06600 [Methanobrevibacter sp.]|uniref:hypothetical protein n=1 Tax=Methanobrevibacter sp. TaxID=66852 RepID=UPI0025EA9C9B|nr:hypothetical protein [Methanobrevibacter sp.]MEE0935327.1 hypothetical protein [Methanobrevibacter sp.]